MPRVAAGCKKNKGTLLNEVVALNGYNRFYASWLLPNGGKRVVVIGPNGQRVSFVGDVKGITTGGGGFMMVRLNRCFCICGGF